MGDPRRSAPELEKENDMYSIVHTDGSGEDDPGLEALPALYDELQSADREHGDVAVVHEETGWSISAHRDGRVVFEQLGAGGERHMIPVPKSRVIELWSRLIDGDIDGLMNEPWKHGYT